MTEKVKEDEPMGDSTIMTIEFLRARLLSERSVSRSAKQRADELSKRVAELEKQLKDVTFERKQVEKTTIEVLQILDKSGISDCSEELGSSTNQEELHQESTEDNFLKGEVEDSVTSRSRETESELPSSEVDGFRLVGRSLSWNSCSRRSDSVKKHISEARRRQSSYVSTSKSSTKPRLGKSCRQIKRMDMRSATEDMQDESLLFDAGENAVTTERGKFSISVEKQGSENNEANVFLEGLVPYCFQDQGRETFNGIYDNGNQSGANMKSAIENQAQLIGRYEAEEIAQREWEDKFREDGSCTPDSWEHGNQSDITEETDELRKATGCSRTIISDGEAANSPAEEAPISLSRISVTETVLNSSMPSPQLDRKNSKALICLPEYSLPQTDNSEPKAKGKQKQENLGTSPCLSIEHHSEQKFSSFHNGEELHDLRKSRSRNRVGEKMQQKTPNELGCVLDALQKAKLSLRREFGDSPSPNQAPSLQRWAGTSLPPMKARDVMDIPLGCAGLFRVPTDFQLEANIPRAGVQDLYSGSRLNLEKNYFEQGTEVVASSRYLTRPPVEFGSRNSTRTSSPIDLSLNSGIPPPFSSTFSYPSYASVIHNLPYQDIFSRPYSTAIGSEMPSAEYSSIYRYDMRPKLHNVPY